MWCQGVILDNSGAKINEISDLSSRSHTSPEKGGVREIFSYSANHIINGNKRSPGNPSNEKEQKQKFQRTASVKCVIKLFELGIA